MVNALAKRAPRSSARAFDEDAAEQRAQSELSAVLYGALVVILVIAVLIVAATGALA